LIHVAALAVEIGELTTHERSVKFGDVGLTRSAFAW